MKIRESIENDRKSIRNVHKNAFDQSEGEIVAQLAMEKGKGDRQIMLNKLCVLEVTLRNVTHVN